MGEYGRRRRVGDMWEKVGRGVFLRVGGVGGVVVGAFRVGRRTSFSCCHFFSQLLVPAHVLSMPLLEKAQRLRMSCFSLLPVPLTFILLHHLSTLAFAVTADFIHVLLSPTYIILSPSLHKTASLSLPNPSRLPI